MVAGDQGVARIRPGQGRAAAATGRRERGGPRARRAGHGPCQGPKGSKRLLFQCDGGRKEMARCVAGGGGGKPGTPSKARRVWRSSGEKDSSVARQPALGPPPARVARRRRGLGGAAERALRADANCI